MGVARNWLAMPFDQPELGFEKPSRSAPSYGATIFVRAVGLLGLQNLRGGTSGASPTHHDFSTFSDGGPVLELSWSHPTLKMAMALNLC